MRSYRIKRALALLLALLLVCLAAGCRKDGADEPSEERTEQTGTEQTEAPGTEQTAPDQTPIPASAGDVEPSENPDAASSGDITVRARDVTVAVVAAGRFGEDAWADSALFAASQVEEAHGITLITLECGGENYEAAMQNAAALADIVVCVGEAFSGVAQAAPQNLGSHWIWLGGSVASPAGNLLCVDCSGAEAGFLAGWAAASLSKSGRIGVVRGDPTPRVEACEAGVVRGAAVGGEDVQVDLRTGSDSRLLQYSLELAELKAEPMIVLSADPEGVVLQTAEEKGARMIVACTDAALCASEQTACTVELDFGKPLEDALLAYLRGDLSLWGATQTVGLAQGCISLRFCDSEAGQQAKNALRSGLEELLQKLQSGEISIG